MGLIVLVWIGFLAIGGLFAWGAYHFLTEGYCRKKKPALGYALMVLIGISLLVAIYLTNQLMNTESFKRWQKSIESEFNGGITRQVQVISENGEIVYKTKGKFDVEYTDGKLKWVDENGKVQIVYLGNSSTAIVNEIDKQ